MSSSNSSGNGLAALIAASTPAKSSSITADSKKEPSKTFASPSFLSPEPAQKPQNKLTLSGQPTRKLKSVKRVHGLSTPSTQLKTQDKKSKKLSLKIKHKKSLSKAARVLEDISNRTSTDKPASHDPTRKLEFPTPVKHISDKKKTQEEPVESSSSSSSSEDEGYSSDEAEVTFDAATIGNMRVVRESLSQSPALSTASCASMPPLGLEYQFSVSSTVSSVAVAPNGKFLVVGFYNGMVYLYPLTKDSLVFRRGVLLDQIMPRGMYTQIMVTVSIPEDGKFIFAGVYRGSTEIRAFEVDSITLPSPNDMQQSNNTQVLTANDSDDSGDEEAANAFGLPSAKSISHTYSDAKLKGFAAARSFYHKGSKKTEYRLLCGIGIKNVHMWRFYQTRDLQWSWECVFDKQTNGISLEFITFHPTVINQFISKSEHQNVRIWHLEEDYDAAKNSVTIRKKSHTDVKQTVDTVAVYGDYAYGGSESLAVIDLQSASRMDLDLPLSAKEQRAQREALLTSRNANSLRAWNPRGSRRRTEDTQRHMRTVSKVAGQDKAPFTVGMCSDGSVFFHQPKKETGIATPLDYIEGYEKFFVDPSLDFQAQFSDLTRVNTSGLLAVLPLPETEKDKWMVVAANQDQLLVRSLDAFLHRNQQDKEYSQVKSDLRNVMRDLGASSDSDSDSDDEKDKQRLQKRTKPQDTGRKVKRSRLESEKASKEAGEKRKTLQKKPKLKQVTEQEKPSDRITTPKRSKTSTSTASTSTASTSTASPVVSISSCSGSSNPNTPEQAKLSRAERQLLALKELQWTPPRTDNQEELTDAAALLTQLSSTATQTKNATKKAIHRIKAQALFADIDSTEDTKPINKPAAKVTKRGRKKSQEQAASEEPQIEEENQVELEKDELDEELEQLEQYEPEFVSVPFLSDNGSLLAATMYQYASTSASSTDVTMMDDVEADCTAAATEQTNLLMQFSHQNERLKMNFLAERERIYKHPDCCASHAKRSSSTGMNWRRNVAHDYLKRKQLKRRHKKQLAAKLQQLHASYAVQIQELYAMQQMQANAFRARQQFQHLHAQIRRQTSKAPSSPSTVTSPIKHSTMPDHLSSAVFPYPDLLS
ncbi:hypothetical protein F441_07519 [Phytophthora nicotianae CJ01A1]|uniref:Uncharacterized protein n=2 Tax=Phytophthora nicotianae TaxID=4792 RepID=W2GZI0_PHYNI|nr:hypothetical protein L915_07361 [Phytophthora nicotianae]ETL41785.1 hypothetical protein L916_07306 [Phytophthora nicotianae]ETP18239.1 hypothetical protein F441_07519 [Phytophthora nicotianae CJ01A1]